MRIKVDVTHRFEDSESIETRLARLEQLGVQLMAQGDQIKAILARVDAATNEVAKDVAELIAKIRAGAPDLLTPAELAAAEASIAKLEALGTDTDASTVAPGGPADPPPVDEV